MKEIWVAQTKLAKKEKSDSNFSDINKESMAYN